MQLLRVSLLWVGVLSVFGCDGGRANDGDDDGPRGGAGGESTASGGDTSGGSGGATATGGAAGSGTGGTTNCDEAACVARSDGEAFCDGSTPSHCVEEDGCLVVERDETCAGGCEEFDGEPLCSGDSCARPMLVTESISLRGQDFSADFADDHSFANDGCIEIEAGASEAVFAIEIEAGETLTATATMSSSSFGLGPRFGLMESCEESSECIAAHSAISFVSDSDQTLYLSLSSATPGSTVDYDVDISLSTCPNGKTEGIEFCDDGNDTDGDGCTSCDQDLFFNCTDGSPSVCSPPHDLGNWTGDSPSAAIEFPSSLRKDWITWHEFTVSEPLLLHVTGSVSTGRMIGGVYSDDVIEDMYVEPLGRGSTDENDDFEVFLAPGHYFFATRATDAATEPEWSFEARSLPNYRGEFGIGQTVSYSGTDLSAGESDYFWFTIEESALFSASSSIVANAGDPDVFVRRVDGTSIAAEDESGATETFESAYAITAGDYLVEVRAFGSGIATFVATLPIVGP